MDAAVATAAPIAGAMHEYGVALVCLAIALVALAVLIRYILSRADGRESSLASRLSALEDARDKDSREREARLIQMQQQTLGVLERAVIAMERVAESNEALAEAIASDEETRRIRRARPTSDKD